MFLMEFLPLLEHDCYSDRQCQKDVQSLGRTFREDDRECYVELRGNTVGTG